MPAYNPAYNVAASTNWNVSGGLHLGTNGTNFLLTNAGWHHARAYRANNGGGWSNAVEIGFILNSGNPFTTFADPTAMINGGAYRYWFVGFNADESQCGISPPHFASQVGPVNNACTYTLGSTFIMAENTGGGSGEAYGPSLPLVPPYAGTINFSNLFETYILDNSHVAADVTITASGYVAPSPEPVPATTANASADFINPASTAAPPSTFFNASIPSVSVPMSGGSNYHSMEFNLSEGLTTPPYYLSIGLLAANGTAQPTTGSANVSTTIRVSYVHDSALGGTPFDSTTTLPPPPYTVANPPLPTPLPCVPCCSTCIPVCDCPPASSMHPFLDAFAK